MYDSRVLIEKAKDKAAECFMRQQVKRGWTLRDESQNKTASKARRSILPEKANVSVGNSPLKKVILVLR